MEIDEPYLGGNEKNKHESKKPKHIRGTTNKQAVLAMRERGGLATALPVPARTDRGTSGDATQRSIEPGSILYTDDHRPYRGLECDQYDH